MVVYILQIYPAKHPFKHNILVVLTSSYSHVIYQKVTLRTWLLTCPFLLRRGVRQRDLSPMLQHSFISGVKGIAFIKCNMVGQDRAASLHFASLAKDPIVLCLSPEIWII